MQLEVVTRLLINVTEDRRRNWIHCNSFQITCQSLEFYCLFLQETIEYFDENLSKINSFIRADLCWNNLWYIHNHWNIFLIFERKMPKFYDFFSSTICLSHEEKCYYVQRFFPVTSYMQPIHCSVALIIHFLVDYLGFIWCFKRIIVKRINLNSLH